jgi:rhodanese-related sulfurtransferase
LDGSVRQNHLLKDAFWKNMRCGRLKAWPSSDSSTPYTVVWRSVLICLIAASLGILVNAVSPRGIPLLGPLPTLNNEGIERIGLKEAWTLFQTGRAVFVDARSREEFYAGHIAGALLVTREDFEESVSSLWDLIPPDALMVTYCAGEGCEASTELAGLLQDAGYTRIKVFYAGWKQWREAGYPVETSESQE